MSRLDGHYLINYFRYTNTYSAKPKSKMKNKAKRLSRKERKTKELAEGIQQQPQHTRQERRCHRFTINLFNIRPDFPRPNPSLVTEFRRDDGALILFPTRSDFQSFNVEELKQFYNYAVDRTSKIADKIVVFTNLMEFCAVYDYKSFLHYYKNVPDLFLHLMDKYFPGGMECLVIALQMRTGILEFDDTKLNEMSSGVMYHAKLRENLAAYLVSNFKIAMGRPLSTYEHQHYDDHPDNMVDIWGHLRLKQWQKFCQPSFRLPDHRSFVARYHGHDKDRIWVIWWSKFQLDDIFEKYLKRERKITLLKREKQALEKKLERAEGKLRNEIEKYESIIGGLYRLSFD